MAIHSLSERKRNVAEPWWFDVTQYPSIQAAIDAAEALSIPGAQIYFPAGAYDIGATGLVINAPTKIMLLGQGDGSVITTSHDIVMLTVNGGAVDFGFTMSDLSFQCTAENPTNGVGVELNSMNNFRLSRLTIGNNTAAPAIGIAALGTFGYATEISECTVYGAVTAIKVQDGCDISHCQQIQGGVYGIMLDNCQGTTHIVSCSVYGQLPVTTTTPQPGAANYCALWAYDLEANYEGNNYSSATPAEGGGSLYLAHAVEEIHLSHCFLQDGVVIGSTLGTNGEVPQPVFIECCEFSNSAKARGVTTITPDCLNVVNASHVTIRGCSFNGAVPMGSTMPVGNGITIESSVGDGKVIIADNLFFGTTINGLELDVTNYFDVHDNSFENSTNETILFTAPVGQNACVSNNIGFNPTGTYVLVTGVMNNTSIPNNYGLDGTFYVSGGDVTGIKIQKDPLGGGMFQSIWTAKGSATLPYFAIPVPAGGAFEMSFTGTAPTVQFIGN